MRFVILLLLAIMSLGLRAQNTAIIHGYVTDSVSCEPAPYAVFQLQNAKGMLVNRAITDAEGRFTMKDAPKMAQIEERESLMESEKNAVQRK